MNARAQISRKINIQVRKLGLKPAASTPRHFAGDAFQSALLAAMSTVFPDGERFFIDSVRHYRDQLQDPALLAEVSAFIGQEAHHGREHETFNEWLEEKGYPVAPILKQVQEGLALARQRLSPKRQLAMTIALEHFTAIMAHQFLASPELSEQMSPEIRELFLWHAVEETEHKAVAYDVYLRTGGDYWTRVTTMLQITLLFWLRISTITLNYLRADHNARPSVILAGLWWMLGKPGPLRRLIPDYLDYYRPGFHPWDQDNRALVKPFQERMAEYQIR